MLIELFMALAGLVAFVFFALWRFETIARKFWQSECDLELNRNMELRRDRDDLRVDRDNLRRANAKLQGKLKFLRESLGEEEGERS